MKLVINEFAVRSLWLNDELKRREDKSTGGQSGSDMRLEKRDMLAKF